MNCKKKVEEMKNEKNKIKCHNLGDSIQKKKKKKTLKKDLILSILGGKGCVCVWQGEWTKV